VAANSAGGVGTTLREAREGRSLTLRQIATATKIPIHALEALELNDISHLPGGIFTRAFVRSYAGQVGLDPEKTVQEFIAQFPHESVTAGHPAAPPIEDNLSIESEQRAASTFLKMILFSLPIAGALLYFEAGRRPAAPVDSRPARRPASPISAPVPEAISTVSPAVPVPQSLPSVPQTTPAAQQPPAAASQVTTSQSKAVPSPAPAVPSLSPVPAAPQATTGVTVQPPAAPDRLTVSLAATGPSWISVIVDGQHVIERRFEAGERQLLEVRGEMVLTTENPSSLVVTINGVETKPLGNAGETVTTRVTRENFKEYLVVP
jgi:cytoskeleton protein RodZ